MSAFAKSLVTTIYPSITECDAQLDNVIAAQDTLLKKLDKVSTELEQLSIVDKNNKTEDSDKAPLPDLEQHTNKIINIKKRVSGTIKKIAGIKQRLEFIENGLNKRKNSLKIHEANLNKALLGNKNNSSEEKNNTINTTDPSPEEQEKEGINNKNNKSDDDKTAETTVETEVEDTSTEE